MTKALVFVCVAGGGNGKNITGDPDRSSFLSLFSTTVQPQNFGTSPPNFISFQPNTKGDVTMMHGRETRRLGLTVRSAAVCGQGDTAEINRETLF